MSQERRQGSGDGGAYMEKTTKDFNIQPEERNNQFQLMRSTPKMQTNLDECKGTSKICLC